MTAKATVDAKDNKVSQHCCSSICLCVNGCLCGWVERGMDTAAVSCIVHRACWSEYGECLWVMSAFL